LPGKGKILIVDDDAALVKMLNVRLLAEGLKRSSRLTATRR